MFPVGDFLRRNTTPYVNWALLAINLAVFVYTLTLGTRPDELIASLSTSETDRFFLDWGFQPACLADYFGLSTDASPRALAVICEPGEGRLLQVFTAMFVHAGWAHFLGNMLFLWIFGDNVEDRVGHLRYLAFYLLCGIAATAVQVLMSTDTLVPTVGASGAIAGVLGAYLILNPTAIVQVVILPLIFIPFFVPAALLIGFWFVMQLFAGIAEIGAATAGSGIAWWAHIGGFAAGAVLVLLLRQPPRRRAYG
jgi:membrane associated rhomboid family serine protease